MRRWFLSYHSPDQALAERLKAAIERKDTGASVFFAPTNLRAGGYWQPALAKAIDEADAFVLLVGDKIGPWQALEYYAAHDKHVRCPSFPVVLMLLEGKPAPGLPFLRQLHWIVTPDPASEKDMARLMNAVAGDTSQTGELWRYTSPYRGLAAMEEKDSDYFFGRERETVEILNALAAAPDRLPVLLGNSGVGKSSLAQAGVLAALRRQAWPERATTAGAWPPAFKDSRGWCYLTLKPGAEPLKALVEPFLQTWQFDPTDPRRETRRAEWIASLRDGDNTLSGLLDATEGRLQERGQAKPAGFFLYVDQGEELYVVRSDEHQRRRFSELIAQGLSDPRLVALMSMRSDFLGHLQVDEPLYKVHSQINVPPLREAELREVVSRPAGMLSARFESDGLVDVITRRTAEDSAKDAGALPLLSYTLDDMWTKMVQRGDGLLRLPAEAFEPGGVLADRANAFLATHPLAEEPLRRVLTLKLATVREDGEPTRRRALRSEFSDDEWRLVSELADHPNRLLVTATPEGGETYAEVAHEAIFRRWTKVQEWIALEREFLIWRSGLERDRRQWKAAPEDSKNDALLWGLALAQAQSWLARRAEDLLTVDREFIELSRMRDAREREERERLRRRTYWIGAAALVLVTVSAGFAGLITYERLAQEAEIAEKIAKQNFEVAVTSAQKLLDQVSKSFARGDIRVKGANDMLRMASEIVEQVRYVENTLKTTALRVKLGSNASDLHLAIGNLTQAYDSARKARDLAEPLRATNPDNPEVLQLLYESTWRMGDAISNRGFDRATQDQALKHYLDAHKIARRLVEMTPEDVARRRDLMFVHQKIGDARQALGDLDAAIAEYRTALTLIQNVVAGAPENRGWRREVATTLRRIGQVRSAKNDSDGALEQLKAALEIVTDLAQEDPNDNVVQANLASNHREIAAVYAQRGELDAALAKYQSAIAIQERLIARDRDNATWQVSLASFYNGMGAVLTRQGDLAGALEQYRKAYALRQGLALNDQTSGGRQNNLAMAAISLADALEAQKQGLDEAVKLYRGAIEILDEVRPRYDRNVFHCYIKIGDILSVRADREGALKEYRVASALAEGTAARNTSSVIWQRNLATSYIKIGDLLAAQERSREALERYQKALEIVTALAAKYPKSAEWPSLAESLKAKIQNLVSKT